MKKNVLKHIYKVLKRSCECEKRLQSRMKVLLKQAIFIKVDTNLMIVFKHDTHEERVDVINNVSLLSAKHNQMSRMLSNQNAF